jgi:hypothetical protein
MGKCYNLTLDSNFFYGGTNNNRRTYFVNWASILPDKAFKVTFSYMSTASGNVEGLFEVMTLLLNLGATNNFTSSSTTNSTLFMGNLKIAACSVSATGESNAYFFAEQNTNPATYLNSRPTQNILEVQLNQGFTGNGFIYPNPDPYILTLHFEEVDEAY